MHEITIYAAIVIILSNRVSLPSLMLFFTSISKFCKFEILRLFLRSSASSRVTLRNQPPGTKDLGLHFRKNTSSDIIGYADSGFKTYPVSSKSQTGYIFIKNGAPISWLSTKQTVTATSTNHAELLSFHKASRKAVWLCTMQQAIL